jgi:hypothetical protein
LLWAARQAGAPAGIPSGVIAWSAWGSLSSTTARLVPLEGAMQEILFVVEEAEDGSF